MDALGAWGVRWVGDLGEADVDVCDVDPGYEVAAGLTTTLRTMAEIWRGDRAFDLRAVPRPESGARVVAPVTT